MKRLLAFTLGMSLLASSSSFGNIVAKQDGNVISISSTQDVVQILPARDAPEAIQEIRQRYRGIEDGEELARMLASGSVIEPLFHLWAEKDSDKRLAWLEQQLRYHHPLVHLEYARELADRADTEKACLEVILHAALGLHLTSIDSICTSDNSVLAAAGAIQFTILPAIQDKLAKIVDDRWVEEVIKNPINQYLSTKLKIEAIREILSSKEKTHSPEWIFAHGMAKYTGSSNQIASKDWDHLRKQELKKSLHRLEEYRDQLLEEL